MTFITTTQRVRKPETNGYRMTANRKALLAMGYSIEDIVNNNMNTVNIPLSQREQQPEEEEDVILLSDSEIVDKQKSFFNTLEKAALGVAYGYSRALVVSGPAGIGKSFGIDAAIGDIPDSDINNTFITGHCTPTGLYATLYNYRFAGCTIVFDDSDAIFHNEVSLGILKHALDMKAKRKISWLSKAEILDDEGEVIPNNFIFEGSIIFISNLNLTSIAESNNKLSAHISAIISRALYMDCYSIFKNDNDYILRIGYLKDSIFNNEGIDVIGRDLIMGYITDNAKNMRELSLRMISKLCHVYKISGANDFVEMASALTGK